MGMWTLQIATALGFAGATALSAACDDGEAAAGETSGGTAAQEQPAGGEGAGESPTALTDQTRRQIREALSGYEQIRAKLAADDGDVAANARQVADAAAAAQQDAPRPLHPHLSGIATEARQLAEAPASDLARVRREFGDVSRHVIALLAAERSLAEGLHVFECGMADGYAKWVQPSAQISNPYMGTRMPACGAPSDLEAS